ncbi:MAG: thioredoxin family protein [Thermoplasmata archaeon]
MNIVKTEREFDRLWNDSDALICDFSATWCGPCRMLEPTLKKLEKAHKGVAFAKVDIDANEGLADRMRIRAVPTLFFVRKGKVVKRIEGLESYEKLDKEAGRLLAPAKAR